MKNLGLNIGGLDNKTGVEYETNLSGYDLVNKKHTYRYIKI